MGTSSLFEVVLTIYKGLVGLQRPMTDVNSLLASFDKRLNRLESLGLVFDIQSIASNLQLFLILRKTNSWYPYIVLNEDNSISGSCFPLMSNGEHDIGEFRIECNIPNQYKIYVTLTDNSYVHTVKTKQEVVDYLNRQFH